MRQIIFATLLMLVLVGTNVACNTVHGLGQDVERAGEKLPCDRLYLSRFKSRHRSAGDRD